MALPMLFDLEEILSKATAEANLTITLFKALSSVVTKQQASKRQQQTRPLGKAPRREIRSAPSGIQLHLDYITYSNKKLQCMVRLELFLLQCSLSRIFKWLEASKSVKWKSIRKLMPISRNMRAEWSWNLQQLMKNWLECFDISGWECDVTLHWVLKIELVNIAVVSTAICHLSTLKIWQKLSFTAKSNGHWAIYAKQLWA